MSVMPSIRSVAIFSAENPALRKNADFRNVDSRNNDLKKKMSTSLDPTPVFHRTKHNSVQINTIFLNYKFTTLTPGLVSSVAVVEILVLE
jgi:hypothetical protein